MSPLFLVGMLISVAMADVKHVLDGQAQPPDSNLVNPGEINYLAHGGAFASSFASSGGGYAGASRAGGYSGGGAAAAGNSGSYAGGAGTGFAATGGGAGTDGDAFWWADTNSPFKHAYDQFKKCSLKGNCFPTVAADAAKSGVQSVSDFVNAGLQSTFDVKKNPFLNGQFQGVAISSCGGAACKGGKPQTVVTTCDGGDCKTSTVEGQQQEQNGNGGSFSFSGGSVGQIDVNKNPFLNGQFAGAGAGANAFAGSNTVTSGNGAQIDAKEGFLGVQPAQPFGNKKPFATNYPSGEQSINQGAQPFPVSGSSYSTNNKKPFASNQPFGGASAGAFSGAFAGSGSSGVEQLKLGGVACQGTGYICVEKSQCLNGVVSSSAGVYQAGNRVS